jgi:tRNA/tmRNA/rRNA uracil-C5-methylase (TrmA/RlmC/RlmD family)
MLDELTRRYGLPPATVVCGSLTEFRHRARLAIRGRLGSPKIGLFEAASHRVVHIPNCRIHHPLINEVASIVRGALVDAQVTCYSDRAHLGLARYLQVVVERRSGTAQVVLMVNAASVEPLAQCLELIRTRLGARLHSLWLNFNRQPNNVILGPDFQHICGPDSVVEEFGAAAIHYPPGAFGQSNLEVAQMIVAHVRERIAADARVTEFYAGVGAIGLSVLDRTSALRLNEVSPQSLHGLALGIGQLEPQMRAKVEVVAGTAADCCHAGDGAQVIIVDPPRKGLDPDLTRYLASHPPEQLLYISCDLSSFVKEVAGLLGGAQLRLVELTAFNLMPFTEHVETVACFRRI